MAALHVSFAKREFFASYKEVDLYEGSKLPIKKTYKRALHFLGVVKIGNKRKPCTAATSLASWLLTCQNLNHQQGMKKEGDIHKKQIQVELDWITRERNPSVAVTSPQKLKFLYGLYII